MLKAKAIVIADPNTVAELLRDCSLRGDFSLTGVADKNGEELEELVARIRQGQITTAIVDRFSQINDPKGDESPNGEAYRLILDELNHRGATIIDIDDFYEKYLKKFNIHSRNGSHALQETRGLLFEVAKRALDVVCASLTLVLLSPILILVSILMKLDSRGSILYLQRRVGLKGKEFTVYKFRTMVEGAEKDKALWAELEDPRVTRLGRLMRKLRIDELPQLFNVLKGEMSIVGPRPERPEFVRELAEKIPHYHERHLVKPGITGWAQINFRYGASVDDSAEKLKYDLYYIKHRSIPFDLYIMLKTIGVVLRGKGR